MRGMTAFGSATKKEGAYEVCAEISTVNKRFLEVSIRLPKAYLHIDNVLRREISQKICRGQLSAIISIKQLEGPSTAHQVDWNFVHGRRTAMLQIAEVFHCKLPEERMCVELCRQSESFSEAKASHELEKLIVQAVLSALDEVEVHRREEGVFLSNSLRDRAAELHRLADCISGCLSNNVERVQKRLQDLVARYVPSDISGDDRVLREVVLLADKADVSEELERIAHHLRHFEETIEKHEPIGKLLDFLLQELLREFSTIGAKTGLTEVSTNVVLAKTEIEKMREQVQNVE